MAPEEKKRSGKAEKQSTSGVHEDILDEQRLVNERENEPREFGGMPESPVEDHEPPARPELKEHTKREDLKDVPGKPMEPKDIERQGS